MSYVFAYKRRFYKRKIKNVVGHNLEGNTMVVFLSNGGLESIPKWDECSLFLGSDWAVFVQKMALRQQANNEMANNNQNVVSLSKQN